MNIARADLIGLSGLDEDEIAAIAEHEHIPEVAAAALASYLTTTKGGTREIEQMICDDIKGAVDRLDYSHAAKLLMALRHLLESYDEDLRRIR